MMGLLLFPSTALTLLCIGSIGAPVVGFAECEFGDGCTVDKEVELGTFKLNSPAKLRLHPPPILYSIPGCGNTWVRMQFDRMLGVHSGSLYNDSVLKKVLPGEFTCNESVSMVKAHPHVSPFVDLFQPGSRSPGHKLKNKGTCLSAIDHYDAAIVLTRDPFRSLFAEYRRRYGKANNGVNGSSHTSSLPARYFKPEHFQQKIKNLAQRMGKIFEQDFRRIIETIDLKRRLFVKFEDLANPHTRAKTLRLVYMFLTDETSFLRGVEPATYMLQRWSDDDLIKLTTAEELHRPPPSAEDVTFNMAFNKSVLVDHVYDIVKNYSQAFNYAPPTPDNEPHQGREE
eukprot:m.160046 g.160046  ORF g.160046 m.160046 type:complete len:341 (+) comp31169_c0_seq1:166-1188(+)